MFERLTIRTDICIEPENDIVYHNPNDPEGMYNIFDLADCLYSGGEAEARILMDISRRLAAYEDSNLSPEEVQSLVQAKADGRLVVLPCKVGQKVWSIKDGKIIDGFVKWFDSFDKCWEAAIENAPKAPVFVPIESIFLTREAAEKALGGGEG